MTSNSNWDTLRRQIRSQENALDASLGELSKLAAQASNAYSSQGSLDTSVKVSYGAAEDEIRAGLTKLEELTDSMTSLAREGGSSSMHHTAQRHVDILGDYSATFKRVQQNFKEAESRANLLGSVRDEISAFKSRQEATDADQLLSERGHIDSSHRMADDILEQAYATRADFARQRGQLSDIQTRMTNTLAQIPGINSLLNMINARRRRDSLILGGLIAFCIILLFWYASS